jgi:hypothetical protein
MPGIDADPAGIDNQSAAIDIRQRLALTTNQPPFTFVSVWH